MEVLPDLALRHIARFLYPEDIVRLSRTSKRMYSIMPRVELAKGEWTGEDFEMDGPEDGHWWPELYFDTPELSSTVNKLSLSVTWQDQGWGNRKGELFLKLMRPVADGEPIQIAKYRKLFGIAEHKEKTSEVEIQRHPVVKETKPGDFYRFMRNVGGGGGHELKVKNFRAVATMFKVMY